MSDVIPPKPSVACLAANFRVSLSKPETFEYAALRSKVGWGDIDPDLVKTALANSLFSVIVRHESVLVGMARIVGDGALFYYIQDLAVDPSYQSRGIGQLLMKEIEEYLLLKAQAGSTVGLLSAKGKESFYEGYGYNRRSGHELGLGMSKFL